MSPSNGPLHATVVWSADTAPRSSDAAIIQALNIAEAHPCELHLLMIAGSPAPVLDSAAQEAALAKHLEQLLPVQQALEERGIACDVEARYDYPFAEAVVRHALEHESQLIIKPYEQVTGFHLGSSINGDDWHLFEACPIPIWFTKPGRHATGGVAAAVELETPERLDQPNPNDTDDVVLRHGKRWASRLDAPLHVVHACEAPEPYSQAREEVGVTSDGGAKSAASQLVLQHTIESEHAMRLHRFASARSLDTATLTVAVDPPPLALARYAKQNRISLVVIGAGNRPHSALQRLLGRPVGQQAMSEIDCDLLIVKPASVFLPALHEPTDLVSLKRTSRVVEH